MRSPWSASRAAHDFRRSAAGIRRQSAWSGRSTTCSASRRKVPWMSARGSITAPGVSENRSRTQPRPPAAAEPYVFLPVEGESLHQIPVGPVHAGIIEPGHFRFSANGETVVRLEERLGYVHKGIEALMAGRRCRARRAAGRAHLGRQHGGLCARLRPGGGSRSGHRGAAARGLAARAHGRARARRQSSRRHRRDLQRRRVCADACPLRRAARTGAACGRGVLRPPPDDGSHRPGRHRRRSVGGWRARSCAGF